MPMIKVLGATKNVSDLYKALIRKGTIPNWQVDQVGDFQHVTGNQVFAGFLRPDASGTTFITATTGGALTTHERGALMGRFIEMLVSHLSTEFASLEVTV